MLHNSNANVIGSYNLYTQTEKVAILFSAIHRGKVDENGLFLNTTCIQLKSRLHFPVCNKSLEKPNTGFSTVEQKWSRVVQSKV